MPLDFWKGRQAGPGPWENVAQSNVTNLTTQIWNHVGRMRQLYNQEKLQWPTFAETEMNDMIVFLYSLNYLDKPGDAAKGEKIFSQKKCIECHFKSVEENKNSLEP